MYSPLLGPSRSNASNTSIVREDQASQRIAGAARAGWEALRARRLADFQTLRRLRGTFRKGLRNNAVFYYSRLLASTGKPIESATLDVFELNATFRPPLRRAEVKRQLSPRTRADTGSSTTRPSRICLIFDRMKPFI